MVMEDADLVVVERTIRKRWRHPVEVLHLGYKGSLTKTLCGRDFDHQTMIPPTSWGKPDRVWCAQCFRARNSKDRSVVSRQRKRFVDFRGRVPIAGGTETREE